MEGSRHARHAVPTPWPKEEFERYTKEIQQKRRAIRAANRPEAEMDALFRDEEKRDTALLNEGAHAGKVGAFEGRELRGARLLSSAGRLHHVHPRQRAVLRRLPPRDRADSRPVQPLGRPEGLRTSDASSRRPSGLLARVRCLTRV